MDDQELLDAARRAAARRRAQAQRVGLDCDDLAQEVLTRYLDRWGRDAEPDNVDAWLATACHHLVIDRARQRGRRPEVGLDVSDLPEPRGADAFRPGGASLFPVRRQAIGYALGRLSPADAALLRRRYIDGCSAADLAQEFGTTVAAVDQRTSRAKRRLRQAADADPELVEALRAAHPRVW